MLHFVVVPVKQSATWGSICLHLSVHLPRFAFAGTTHSLNGQCYIKRGIPPNEYDASAVVFVRAFTHQLVWDGRNTIAEEIPGIVMVLLVYCTSCKCGRDQTAFIFIKSQRNAYKEGNCQDGSISWANIRLKRDATLYIAHGVHRLGHGCLVHTARGCTGFPVTDWHNSRFSVPFYPLLDATD